MQQREVEEDNMDAITAPSTSFYAVRTLFLKRIETDAFHLNSTNTILFCRPSSLHSRSFFTFVDNVLQNFFQSLETRPRSIYDVLDHSAAKKEPNQRKAKPKKKEPQEKVSVDFRLFVTFAVIKEKPSFCCSWSRVLYFLHRCHKPHKNRMKAHLSVSMRIFES